MSRGIFTVLVWFGLGCGPGIVSGTSETTGTDGTSDSATATSTGPSTSASASTTGPECQTDADCGDFDTCEDGKCVECIGCCSLVEHPKLPRCSPPIDTETSSGTSDGTGGSDTGTSTSTGSTTGGVTPQGLCEQTGGTWDRFSCGHYDCGVPSPDACVDPGCDCGKDSNYLDGVGCQVDPRC